MNITIQGVDITLTPEQLKKLQTYLPPQEITEKIKTLDDVYKHLGVRRIDVIPFFNPINKSQKRSNAIVDIEHIALALNEGWTPDFDNHNQYKYHPFFTKKPMVGWVVDYYYCYSSFADCGFGLYFKNSKLALYAANTFFSVYIDYLP